MRRHGLKKGLSLLLVFCMILSLLPMTALAEEISEPSAAVEEQSPASGDTTAVDTGEDQQDEAGTGETSEAGTGETGEAGTGETGETGEAGTGETGEAGTGETGEAGTGEAAEAGTGETGEAGTGEADTGEAGTGEAGTGETAEEEEEKSFIDEIIDGIKDALKPITGEKTPEQIAEEEALAKAEWDAEAKREEEEAAAQLAAEAAAAEELEKAYTVEVKKSARDTSGDDFYKVVHLDAGRKYFSVDSIKDIINIMAGAGYNQLELYLSDNQGFRFALNDMTITTDYDSYDLSAALGDGYSDGSKYPDGSNEFLTEEDMNEIITYANEKNIEIVPCINTPGHMGAILEEFFDLRYSGSKSSIDLENPEAVAFALAIVKKYAGYFARQGCDFFNIGADEYANDLSSTMGFESLYTAGKYQRFVDYLNAAAQIVINEGMTPRAFNDGIYYNNDTSYSINEAIQVCYWSAAWRSGYALASAETISREGHDMINTHGDYYWVLGNSGWQCSVSKAQKFDYKSFPGSTISSPEGAMFCIWCDVGSADGQDGGAKVVIATADVIEAFGATLPAPATGDGSAEHPYDLTMEENKDVLDGIRLNKILYLTMDTAVQWKVEDPTILSIAPVDGTLVANYYAPSEEDAAGDADVPETQDVAEEDVITAKTVSITALNAGTTTLTAGGQTFSVTVNPEGKRVTVAVGETETDFIEGGNCSIKDTELNTSIATVTAKYEKVPSGTERELGSIVDMSSDGTYTGLISDGTNYLVLNGTTLSSTTDINEATVWTVTRSSSWWSSSYTIQSGSYYLSHNNTNLSVSTNTNNASWSYSSSNGFYYTSGGLFGTTYYLRTNNGSWQVSSTSSNHGKLYSYTEVATEPKEGTTVTFIGVSPGTTYVTVGNVRYTIIVPEEDLSKVTPLTVEFWITNLQVTADDATSKSISAQSVYGESGVDLSYLLPDSGTYAYGSVVYWKGTVLDASNHQTTAPGAENDKTGSGEDFSMLRYYNGAWQYYYGNEWKTISSTDQVVAYWLQPTEVTKEITTLVKDWGYSPSNQQGDNNNKVALTVAVVYPDGTVSPAEGDMYSKSTTLFNYWDGRNIGLVAPQNNSSYEISKITVTNGTRDQSGTGQWGIANTITWDKVELDDGSKWYNETTYWDKTVGGTPMVNGVTSNITWSNYNTAKLVLIYLKPVHYDTNLIVNWVDDSANGAVIATMEVSVSSDGTPITFYNGLMQTSDLPTEGVGGTFILDDNAYVTNSSNVNQTFNKNIATVPGVAAQYKSGLYQYISAELSADGKTLTLHYNINSSKLSKQYVVDFGLPVTVPLSELVENPAEVTAIAVVSNNAAANVASGITYQPDGFMTGMETVRVNLTFNNGSSSQTYTIGFVPATTVYYEQGFATYSGSWTNKDYVGTATQTLEAVGSKQNVYGYDPAYAAVGAAATANTTAASNTIGDTATFTFTGTGVDIYADCGINTGTVMIKVERDGAVEKLLVVNTAMVAGETDATKDKQAVSAKNVPIASIEGLSSGPKQHTVTITHVGDSKSVYLDGFRVHQTLAYDTAAYNTDQEVISNMVELRDLVILNVNANAAEQSQQYKDQIVKTTKAQVLNTSASAAVFRNDKETAGITTANLVDVIDNGPKNEIYLASDETLAFIVDAGQTVQVGVKALTDGASGTINDQTVKSSTDMFYKVTAGNDGLVTIKGTAGVLAVTELKFCS